MPCIEVKTKKYQSRSAPPYHAKDCKGEIKLGNNGKKWKSIPNKKLIYIWVPISNNKSNKSSTNPKTRKMSNSISGKTYYIHDNGGQPFKVICNKDKKIIYIYKDTRDFSKFSEFGNDIPDEPVYDKLLMEIKYEKIFTGDPLPSIFTESKSGYSFEPGNSILVCISVGKYIYIGSEIYSFQTGKGIDDEIIKYYSPIGNNDVPYPFAVSRNKTYLMIEDVILDNQELDNAGKDCEKKYNNEYFNDPYYIYYEFCNTTNNLKKTSKKIKKKILQQRL